MTEYRDINIPLTLDYIAVVLNGQAPYSFTIGSFTTDYYTWWETIVWLDVRPQPLFDDIYNNYADARMWISMTNQERIETAEAQIDALETSVSNLTAAVTALQSASNKSIAQATRAVDTPFQISATKDALVSYSGQIVATSSLTGGQLGSIVLEYANDLAFTSGVVPVAQTTNGQTGALVVGLVLVQTFAAPLTGVIPKGKYVRLRAVDTTGAPVQSLIQGQETQF